MGRWGEHERAVQELLRYMASHPQASVREAAREIAPDNPEAVRSAYRRRRDKDSEVLRRVIAEQLVRDPSSVLSDLSDDELRRVTEVAVYALRDRMSG